MGNAFGHSFEVVSGKNNEVLIHRVSHIKVGVAAKGIGFYGFSWFVS